MEPSKEYDSLFRQYSDKSQEELERIISSEGDYTELAKKAARDVLNSDRTEYYQKITEQVNKEKAVTQKIEITSNRRGYQVYEESYYCRPGNLFYFWNHRRFSGILMAQIISGKFILTYEFPGGRIIKEIAAGGLGKTVSESGIVPVGRGFRAEYAAAWRREKGYRRVAVLF